MRRTLLIIALTFALLLLWSRLRDSGPAQGGGAGLETAPQLYYALDAEQPLRLAVTPGTTRIKLLTHLEMPSGTPFDDALRYPYGLRLTLVDGEAGPRWTQELWFETARRRLLDASGLHDAPIEELAWLVADDAVLSETRAAEVTLERATSAQAELLVEVLDAGGHRVLVRPYRRLRAPSERAAAEIRGLSEERRQRAARKLGASGWSELAWPERATLGTLRWRRMEARGARGQDYWTRRVIVASPDEDTRYHSESPEPYLLAGRAQAFNLRGPTEVRLEVHAAAAPPPPGTLSVTLLGQGGALREEPWPVGELSWELVIEQPGVHTLTVFNRGERPVDLRASVAREGFVAFGDDTSELQLDSGRLRLKPDYRTFAHHRVLADAPPLRWDMRRSRGHRIRIERRRALLAEGEGPRGPVQARLFDGSGALLSSVELPVLPGVSPYEFVADPPGQPPRFLQAGQRLASELWVPQAARRLELVGEAPVDVRVSVPLVEPWRPGRVEPPYELDTDGVQLIYEPLAESGWQWLRPEDAEALDEQGRRQGVTAQVRLEPWDPAVGDDALADELGWRWGTGRRDGFAWEPEGEATRRVLLERGGDLRGDWPPGARVALTPGVEAGVRIGTPERPGTQLLLEVSVDDDATLGSRLPVWVDGRLLAELPLDAPWIAASLGPLEPGAHEVRAGAPGAPLRMWIDAPTEGGEGTLWRQRTVYRLDRGRDLSVAFQLAPRGTATLLVLPYFEVPQGGRAVPAEVDLAVQAPRHRPPWLPFERTTPHRTRHQLVPGAEVGELVGREGSRIVAGDPVSLRAGRDVSGSRVRVTLQRRAGGGPLWVRFVVLGVEPPAEQAGNAWVRGVEAEGLGGRWADPFAEGPAAEALLDQALGDARGPMVQAPVDALPLARALGRRLIEAARAGATRAVPPLQDEARGLGFELSAHKLPGLGDVLVLRGADADEGRSLLLLRFGAVPAGHLLLQAPHAFHDRRSAQVALRLLASSGARALQVGVRHREVLLGEERSDLAHRSDTWFHALLAGLADGVDAPVVAQVHGYARESVSGAPIDLIVAGGARPRRALIEGLVAQLRGALPGFGVALYPDDTALFGARTNAQGRALARRPAASFVHLEMSPELREAILTNDALAISVGEALRARPGAPHPPPAPN